MSGAFAATENVAMRKLLLPILVPLALLAGCAENQESLIVLDAPAWKDGECAVDPGGDTSLPFGVLDLLMTPIGGYVMPATLLNNTRVQQSNKTNSGIQSNEFQLTGADVTLSSPQDPSLLDGLMENERTFNAPLPTISLRPQETAGVVVEVIPAPTARAFATRLPDDQVVTVVASVTFRASRSGNVIGKVGAIAAREFEFPVKLCKGCMRSCEPCGSAKCPIGIGNSDTEWTRGVCGNWQDANFYPLVCADNAGN